MDGSVSRRPTRRSLVHGALVTQPRGYGCLPNSCRQPWCGTKYNKHRGFMRATHGTEFARLVSETSLRQKSPTMSEPNENETS